MNWLHWALLSALFAGLTAVLAKVGVKDIDSNLATAIRTVVILVFAWVIVFFRSAQSVSAVSGRAWAFLVLSGLATGASWLCYFRALQLGEASRVAPVDKLSVVVPLVLAVGVLGEPLTWGLPRRRTHRRRHDSAGPCLALVVAGLSPRVRRDRGARSRSDPRGRRPFRRGAGRLYQES